MHTTTWTKWQTIQTVAQQRAALVSIASIYCLFPSTRAIQVRSRSGLRRPVSPNPAAMTAGTSLVTLAVSHFSVAAGPRLRGRARRCLGSGLCRRGPAGPGWRRRRPRTGPSTCGRSSPGRQAGGQLGPRGSRRPCGGRMQRLRAYHDALTLVLHHLQHVARAVRA